jgi:hypothetical protein
MADYNFEDAFPSRSLLIPATLFIATGEICSAALQG